VTAGKLAKRWQVCDGGDGRRDGFSPRSERARSRLAPVLQGESAAGSPTV